MCPADFFDVITLPTETDADLRQYIPEHSVVLAGVNDEWSVLHIGVLEQQGYEVIRKAADRRGTFPGRNKGEDMQLMAAIIGRSVFDEDCLHKYIRNASYLFDHLIIGIVEEVPELTACGSFESKTNPPPVSYQQMFQDRRSKVHRLIEEWKWEPDSIDVITLPADADADLRQYIPEHTVVLVGVNDEWSVSRIGRLEQQGYEVIRIAVE